MSDSSGKAGIWDRIASNFQLISHRPRLADDVKVRRSGASIEMSRASTGKVIELSEAQVEVARQFDGARVLASLEAPQGMTQSDLLGFYEHLVQAGMIDDEIEFSRALEDYIVRNAAVTRSKFRDIGTTDSSAGEGSSGAEGPIDRTPVSQFEQVVWRPRTPMLADRAQFLRSVELLQSLDAGTIGMIAEAAHEEAYPAASNIVVEGDSADRFFIVKSGDVNVTKRNPEGKAERLARLGPGDWFGEVGILEGASRNATVRAGPSRPVQVLSFDSGTFERYISPHVDAFRGRQVKSRRRQLLASMSLFQGVGDDVIDRIAMSCHEQRVPEKTVVISQGDNAEQFFMIVEGAFGVVRDGVAVAKLTEGDFFGETALLFTGARQASVISMTDSFVLVVDKPAFDALIKDHLTSRRDLMPTVLNRLG